MQEVTISKLCNKKILSYVIITVIKNSDDNGDINTRGKFTSSNITGGYNNLFFEEIISFKDNTKL